MRNRLPSVSVRAYRAYMMEGIARPEISPGPAGTAVHAWVPDSRCGCGFCGAETHAEDADELAAKLAEP